MELFGPLAQNAGLLLGTSFLHKLMYPALGYLLCGRSPKVAGSIQYSKIYPLRDG